METAFSRPGFAPAPIVMGARASRADRGRP